LGGWLGGGFLVPNPFKGLLVMMYYKSFLQRHFRRCRYHQLQAHDNSADPLREANDHTKKVDRKLMVRLRILEARVLEKDKTEK
jgi:hypothetical protein